MIESSTAQHSRFRRWWWLILAAVIVLAPVAWYLGSPLFINRTVNEAFPMSTGATVPDGMTRRQVEGEMQTAAAQTTTASEAMPAAGEPKALARGAFQSADGIHKGTGTATAYQVGQDIVVRLDPFESTNGPALHVYLSGATAPKSRGELERNGYLDLGTLKGNIGAQNYTLPAGTDLARFKSVVIYCQRFHVVFSSAQLGAAQ
jgi:hypothetical protein